MPPDFVFRRSNFEFKIHHLFLKLGGFVLVYFSVLIYVVSCHVRSEREISEFTGRKQHLRTHGRGTDIKFQYNMEVSE